MEILPDWLDDLMDEYPTNRSDNAIIRLARVFADVPAGVMQAAVDTYMREGNKFFPKVGDLSPCVTKTQEWQVQELTPAQWHERKMNDVRKQVQHSDDAMLAWEIRRGTAAPEVAPVIIEAMVELSQEPEWETLFA